MIEVDQCDLGDEIELDLTSYFMEGFKFCSSKNLKDLKVSFRVFHLY